MSAVASPPIRQPVQDFAERRLARGAGIAPDRRHKRRRAGGADLVLRRGRPVQSCPAHSRRAFIAKAFVPGFTSAGSANATITALHRRRKTLRRRAQEPWKLQDLGRDLEPIRRAVHRRDQVRLAMFQAAVEYRLQSPPPEIARTTGVLMGHKLVVSRR